jgi:hypothetical protein
LEEVVEKVAAVNLVAVDVDVVEARKVRGRDEHPARLKACIFTYISLVIVVTSGVEEAPITNNEWSE